MKVKEFLDVVCYNIIYYAKIYEMRWNENYQDYDSKYTDKRVHSTKDLEPYYDCELDYFDYKTQWGEYDDSAIYIKIPIVEDSKMTVKELKEELNNFDDNMEIEFLPRIMLNGNLNYPKPFDRKDMADIDVFKNGDKCTIENNADYYID